MATKDYSIHRSDQLDTLICDAIKHQSYEHIGHVITRFLYKEDHNHLNRIEQDIAAINARIDYIKRHKKFPIPEVAKHSSEQGYEQRLSKQDIINEVIKLHLLRQKRLKERTFWLDRCAFWESVIKQQQTDKYQGKLCH